MNDICGFTIICKLWPSDKVHLAGAGDNLIEVYGLSKAALNCNSGTDVNSHFIANIIFLSAFPFDVLAFFLVGLMHF